MSTVKPGLLLVTRTIYSGLLTTKYVAIESTIAVTRVDIGGWLLLETADWRVTTDDMALTETHMPYPRIFRVAA